MKLVTFLSITCVFLIILSLSVSAQYPSYYDTTYKASASESHVITKASSWSTGKQSYQFSSKDTTTQKTTTNKGKTTTTNKHTFTFSETSTNKHTTYANGNACRGQYHPARYSRADPDAEHYYDPYYYKPCPQADGSTSWRY